MECIDPKIGRLITRFELDALEPAEQASFTEHLIQCEFCHNEVFAMAPIMKYLRTQRELNRRGKTVSGQSAAAATGGTAHVVWWRKRAVLIAAAVMVALVGCVWAMTFLGGRSSWGWTDRLGLTRPAGQSAPSASQDWAGLEIPIAQYSASGNGPLMRGGGPSTAFEQAMMAYQQGDYSTATVYLEALSRLEPEQADVQFFWGVSLLQLGRAKDAVAPLREAAGLGAGEKLERSRYYLALAYLKSGRTQSAVNELETVIGINGRLRPDAERLLGRVTEKK